MYIYIYIYTYIYIHICISYISMNSAGPAITRAASCTVMNTPGACTILCVCFLLYLYYLFSYDTMIFSCFFFRSETRLQLSGYGVTLLSGSIDAGRCYAMLCNAMLCNAILSGSRRRALHYAMLCYAMLCYIMLQYSIA